MDEISKLTEQLKIAESELARLDQGTSAYNRKLKEVERLSSKASAAFNSQTGSMISLGRAYDTVKSKIVEFANVIAAEAKALDNSTIEFQRQTAATADLAENIGRLTDNLAIFGVSLADASETVSALQSGFTEFTQVNVLAQRQISTTVALLNELGISASSSAKILESSTKTLGMTTGETLDMLVNLRGAATALGVPIEKLTQDFIGAEEMLAKLGRTGPDTFKRLSAQAKATGVELSKITALAEKFDTFESAASAAQGLNAVLGGNFLDSLYMIEEVDPAQRFLAIRDAIFEAGLSAESLADSNNYYLKKSLAATLGLPVSDFMKMLTGDVNELTGEVMAAATSFEELREQAFKMKGFDDILKNTFDQFKKPVTEIQRATRDAFELLTPLRESIQKYTESVTKSTNTFIMNNRKLVGGIGLLYNFFGMDVAQQFFDTLGGIGSAFSQTLGFVFSLKGLLFGLTGGAIALLHDKVHEIKAAFHLGGVFAAIDTAIVLLVDKIKALMGPPNAGPGGGGLISSIFSTIIASGKFAFHALKNFVFVPLANYFIREFFFYGDTLITFFQNKVLPTIADGAIKVSNILSSIFATLVTEIKGAIVSSIPGGRMFYNTQDQENDRKNIASRLGARATNFLLPFTKKDQFSETFARGTTGNKVDDDLTKRLNIERFMQRDGYMFDEGAAQMGYQRAMIDVMGDKNIKAASTAINTQLMPAINSAVSATTAAVTPVMQEAVDLFSEKTSAVVGEVSSAIQQGFENVEIKNQVYIDGKEVTTRTLGKEVGAGLGGGAPM